jgi:Rap1a immunity proteins
MDTFGLHDGVWLTDGSPYCVGGDVDNEQELRIILKYLRENPAKDHLPVSTLFLAAMREVFPCPK